MNSLDENEESENNQNLNIDDFSMNQENTLEESENENVNEPSEEENINMSVNESENRNLPLKQLVDEELIDLWDTTTNFIDRDIILEELQKRNLFPSSGLSKWEYETGAYPDIRDPMFLQKLLAKREFADSLQKSWKPSKDPCEDDGAFEVTPVQRFVANFMSPKTPYMSALLYHGVGVGKTCAAIQIAEAWLDIFPRSEVFIVAPPTIQEGFFKTIFDINKIKFGEENEPNRISQCTGDKYMRLSNTLFEKDKARIERSVNKLIKRRYKVFGYISFANHIKEKLKREIPDNLPDDEKELYKKKIIRSYFNNKLLIVDEAHNLRDLSEQVADEELDFPGGKAEKSDAAAGKQLTPYLRNVLQYSEGMKFVMLTATPMYNTYREIIFLLNLLLMNDKQANIKESDVFDTNGNITDKGNTILSTISRRYVSFMRGENPISFPIRLFPQNIPSISRYPDLNPRGKDIPDDSKDYYKHLPIVPILFKGRSLEISKELTRNIPEGGEGLGPNILDRLIQAGNFTVPLSANNPNIISYKLEDVFNREISKNENRFRAKNGIGSEWLSEEYIENYSPKFAFLLKKLRQSEGVVFAYTRFIMSGAVPLALVLEANGYSPWGRNTGLLVSGIQSQGGRQCALCPQREKNHTNNSHNFTPAYYGLLTGDKSLSPNNEAIIQAEKAFDNVNGSKIKIVIGSQIASEGVDFRFVRETHVIDSWYHLNKTEQILGRAIRYMSHCALPKEKRNNTVYLYACVFPDNSDLANYETADLFSYRTGFKKAVLVGKVTRLMKQNAIDCNLNNQAIIIQGQEPVDVIDSQRQVREGVNINDMPFTAICDWIETCDYKCTPEIDIAGIKNRGELDDSTYDEFSARWKIEKIKERIKYIFKSQVYFRVEDFWNIFSDVPRIVMIDLLNQIVDNRSFVVYNKNNQPGYIRYCNTYYIFQPNVYLDLNIPLSIRAAKFPIKRDNYIPITMLYEEPEYAEEITIDETSKENIENIWSSIKSWCESLAINTKYVLPPREIDLRIIDMSQDNYDLKEKYKQILEIVEWFHTAFHKSPDKDPELFKKTILLFFWDKWLTLTEQIHLIYKSSINISECVKSSQYQLGRLLINRLLDPSTGKLKYLCENGDSCSTAIIDEIERDRDQPMKQFKVNYKTIGDLYGFIVPKNGDVVFKVAQPPYGNDPVSKGKECATVSNMSGHIKDLIEIGNILKEKINYDFDLNYITLTNKRKIKNSIRACTLLELVLRYMDYKKVDGKKWFLRSVLAYYTGHKGLFRTKKS